MANEKISQLTLQVDTPSLDSLIELSVFTAGPTYTSRKYTLGALKTLVYNGTADNISGGAGGQLLYQSGADTTSKLANGSAGQVLQSNGGTSAPSWVSPSSGASLLTAVISCTASQIKNIGTTPIRLITSSGANKIIQIIQLMQENVQGSVAMSTTYFYVKYAGASLNYMYGYTPNGAGTTNYYYLTPYTSIVNLVAKGSNVDLVGVNSANGDGTMKIIVSYCEIDV